MTAKDLFLTFIYTGMEPMEAYGACFRQGVFSPEEMQELLRLCNTGYGEIAI